MIVDRRDAWIAVLLLPTLSGLSSVALTGVVRRVALRHRILDRPNERSSHSRDTPRGGGAGVLGAVLVAIGVGAALAVVAWRDALTIGSGLVALGAVGWADDRGEVSARIRLMVQIVVAAWTMWMFRGLPDLQAGTSTIHLGPWGFVLGLVGIVWSTNLFNFMDGIDGIAGSQAMLIFGSLAALEVFAGNISLAAISAVLAAAAAGFLAWNWPPAKIFLGDVGSGPLGYAAAALAIASEVHRSVPLIAVAIIAGVFIVDATVTLMRRIARGARPAEAHRDHAYQRLARAWGAHWRVSAAAAVVTGGLALLATVGTLVPHVLPVTLLFAYALLSGLFVVVERAAPMGSGSQEYRRQEPDR